MIYIILLVALLNIIGIIFFRNNRKILLILCIAPVLVVGIVAVQYL